MSHSVRPHRLSHSVRPHRRQPTRLPCPCDFPGKNNGAGCHFLLQCMKVKGESEVTQLCPTLCDPMGCSPPGSSAHGIFQARVLEWVLYLLLLLLLLSSFSRVPLCATPQTAAHQAPPSLGFSRQEHWSGLPFPSPFPSVDGTVAKLLVLSPELPLPAIENQNFPLSNTSVRGVTVRCPHCFCLQHCWCLGVPVLLLSLVLLLGTPGWQAPPL